MRPGSWFHQTECFGPVLGLMSASDLDDALAIANGTPFGLTGGIHTLDPDAAARWLEGVEVGNAYINRVITGAVVQRQPFGGWKGSVVGTRGQGRRTALRGPARPLASRSGCPRSPANPPRPCCPGWRPRAGSCDEPEREWLSAAVRSDAWWQRAYFGIEHDPTGLFCESNVLRFRPRRRVVLWVAADARPAQVLRAYAAAAAAGCDIECVSPPGSDVDVGGDRGRVCRPRSS